MAKEKKEKRESKMEKKSLLKVKSKNKFKKKAVVNEAIGIENEHSTVIPEDNNGKKIRKGEKNTLAKIMKKKLKEKMNKKLVSSIEIKNEEKIPSENKEQNIILGKEKKQGINKTSKKKDLKRKKEKNSNKSFDEISQLDEDTSKEIKRNEKKKKIKVKENIEEIEEKSEEIKLVDEDSSKGMKKWLNEYKESRPGTKILLQKIDDFVISHEEKLEQEKKEREAKVAEEGWTVVAHNKGRRKSTDPETGTAFGSVNEAAILDKMSKKKKTDVHLDFYGFQKRQAHRTEIMKLQSEFEKDRKLVQQMKAARKFRP